MCLHASKEASSRLRITECFAVHSVFTWDTITNDEQTTGEAGYICNIILCKNSFWSLEYTVISIQIAIKIYLSGQQNHWSILYNWPLLSQFGIRFKVERLSQAGVRSMRVSQAGDFKMVVSSNCRIGTFAT